MQVLGDVQETLLGIRKRVWHVRHGGIKQLKTFLRREQLFGRNHGDLVRSGAKVLTGSQAVGEIPKVVRDPRLGSGYRLEFEPSKALPLPLTYPGVRAAVILDDFSLQAWGAEFETVVVTPEDWLQQITENPVDFLLVESAWAGNGGAWQYHLTGPSAPRPAVIELLAWCKEQGIPSVFWNKEDPPHFEDFLDTARLFDYVFTSDSNMVPRYREKLGHDRVFPLSFAAAPSLHNPIRASKHGGSRGVAFAGTYFAHKFPERREQMDTLLTGALAGAAKSGEPFEIYSRFWGKDAKYQFPEPFASHVVGSLPYLQMVRAYKAHKVFLNVNSVIDSPSMCARRIFEILASGTPVVTTGSAAIRQFFDERQLLVVENEADAELKVRSLLNSEVLRARSVHMAQREIWTRHTYAHRAQQVLQVIGVQAKASLRSFVNDPLVTVMVATMRPHQVEKVFETVGRQKDVQVQLILLTHGFTLKQSEANRLAKQHGINNFSLLQASSAKTLGECMNLMVAAAQGEVITKMDDDDLYGDYYLIDQLNCLKFSGADLVGKGTHYMYLKNTDITVLRRANVVHRFTDFVAGPTIMGWAVTFRANPFDPISIGEDSAFLESVLKANGSIYATSPFNFIQVRQSQGSHTWDISDETILARNQAVYYGLNKRDIML
ncbi:CgeB family protein [Rothia sp. 11254D007CT]